MEDGMANTFYLLFSIVYPLSSGAGYGQTAVYDDLRAGDIRRLVGSQKKRAVSDVFGLSQPAQRDQLRDSLLRLFAQFLLHRSIHETRVNNVGADLLVRINDGNGAAQRDQSSFAGGVGVLRSLVAAQRRDGAGRNN